MNHTKRHLQYTIMRNLKVPVSLEKFVEAGRQIATDCQIYMSKLQPVGKRMNPTCYQQQYHYKNVHMRLSFYGCEDTDA